MPGAGTSGATQDTTKHSLEMGSTASSTAGTTQQQQQQNTSSNVGPWSATQPLLSNILTSLGGMSTSPSPGQSDAVANLQSAANSVPNFGNQASGVTSDLLSSSPKYNGMLTGGLSGYQGGLQPYLDPNYLNPNSTPGFSDAINTLKGDITNQVNDQFAAAGRDLSPGNTTALARGLTQGIAPVIANQFNQNVATQRGAQDAGLGATFNGAGMLSGLDQTALGNRLQGVGSASMLPGVYTAPATAQLGAANTGYGLPYQNLGMLEGLTLPISQLGQTSSGTGTTTGTGATTGNTSGSYAGQGYGQSNTVGTQTMSPLAMMSSLFGSPGGAGSAAGMLSFLSDERAKEDIKPVGMLFDGQTVHAYRYKGDPRPQIGLIAQEVERAVPDAVSDMGGGLKGVHYGRATAKARHIGGMLDGLSLAA